MKSSSKSLHVAAATLNQTPLDWEGNVENIRHVLTEARRRGVQVISLPELCISGYGCEDAFDSDYIVKVTRQSLAELLPATKGLVTAIGVPVRVNDKLYNAAAIAADGVLYGFVAKQFLANYGIHYEGRWFTPWKRDEVVSVEFGGKQYPFGDLLFDVDGVRIGVEICHDACVGAERPLADLSQAGVQLVLNLSASHFAFGRGQERRDLVSQSSRDYGVSYLYSNLLGNEAGRIIYPGTTLVAADGEIVAEGPRLSFENSIITEAIVPVPPRADTAKRKKEIVSIPFKFSSPSVELNKSPQQSWEHSLHCKEEELARAVSLGLYDYLRKSKAKGFVVSLSGGVDSTAVSCLVHLMVRLGVSELGIDTFTNRLPEIAALSGLSEERELQKNLLTCIYQRTKNNSETTRHAASHVAQALGATFMDVAVDDLVDGYQERAEAVLGRELSWEQDDIALQNIQARVRSPFAWLIANVNGGLLLSTSNRSEAAVGYATMDGDTSGSLSPIAGVDKAFLMEWLSWLEHVGVEGVGAFDFLSVVTSQIPTAELRPLAMKQSDEDDLMPYPLLNVIEGYAIGDRRSPNEVFFELKEQFREQYEDAELARWVHRFFTLWCRNQWKRERLAPSFHLDDKNLDPKSWCRFPILSSGFARELRALKSLGA